MKEEPYTLVNMLCIIALVAIGLGAVIWQIFKAEQGLQHKPEIKKTEDIL